MAKFITVFVNNQQLSAAGIQFLVALATLAMVIRFVLDAHRHRSNSRIKINSLLMLDAAAYSLLHFSLGVMQRPSLKNSYYHVWAVLLVTLRYSVKYGRPAGITLRQTPLVDLMSSFWAANILRSRAVMTMLKIPVWLLWSINSARIIHGFVSSEHATASHKDNERLVVEYMRQEHQPPVALDPVTMKGYRYLVLGEAKQKKEAQPPHYRLELKLTHEEKFITLDKIWEWEHGHGGDSSARRRRVSELLEHRNGMLKDLCLSFALYKLLRRRFHNLPIYESKLSKTKQLIFDGILGDGNAHSTTADPESEACSCVCCLASRGAAAANSRDQDHHKRVFRITTAELSFLNDFFYSRHALLFANGFPFLRLFLSSLLVGAIAYMAVAIHQFSKIAKEDELGRVLHGVIFTWILLSLLGVKEIIEIAGYVFSDWTKVLLVCNYVRHPWWLRGQVMGTVVRLLCRYSLVKRWHGKIGQYNLVFGVGQRHIALTDLPEEVQKALLLSLRSLRNPSQDSYLDKAFSAVLPAAADEIRETVRDTVNKLEGDVHKVLLWHIATCYCELHLADSRKIGVTRPWWVQIPILGRFRNKNSGIWTGPFVEQSGLREIEKNSGIEIEKHYITAMRLSQYCAHALRLNPPLIPGNDIITTAVLGQVIWETRKALPGYYSIPDTFRRLNDYQGSSGDTLLKMGSKLGQVLISATAGNDQHLWDFLAQLWAGFVLHLAESTRASKHKIYLSVGGELMTHLWALLSHAGLMGDAPHGETGSSAMPFPEAQQEGDLD